MLTNILTQIAPYLITAAAALLVWRAWKFSAAAGSGGPITLTKRGLATGACFLFLIAAVPNLLIWGTNRLTQQIATNPGVQAGFTLGGYAAGTIDSITGAVSGAVPAGGAQIQLPQLQLPAAPAGGSAPAAAPQSLNIAPAGGIAGFVQGAIAPNQVQLPQIAVPNAAQPAQPAAGAAPAAGAVQAIQQVIQAVPTPSVQDFSWDSWTQPETVPADCLTGDQQGPQLPHCVNIDRSNERAALDQWTVQNNNIQRREQEAAAEALQNFSWSADISPEVEAGIARAAANATVQAQSAAAAQQAQQAAADAAYQAQLAQQQAAAQQAQQAQAQAMQNFSFTTYPQPTPQAQVIQINSTDSVVAPVYQANSPAIPSDCLTGNQQGPQLPHCMNVDRSIHGQDGGSVWAMAGD